MESYIQEMVVVEVPEILDISKNSKKIINIKFRRVAAPGEATEENNDTREGEVRASMVLVTSGGGLTDVYFITGLYNLQNMYLFI